MINEIKTKEDASLIIEKISKRMLIILAVFLVLIFLVLIVGLIDNNLLFFKALEPFSLFFVLIPFILTLGLRKFKSIIIAILFLSLPALFALGSVFVLFYSPKNFDFISLVVSLFLIFWGVQVVEASFKFHKLKI